MRIFVSTLDTAADRLEFMGEQLESDFDRSRGVSGAAVPDRLITEFDSKTLLPGGEIGCYSSHLLAAETILERKLEDDVELAAIWEPLRPCCDWDVLSLSGAKQHPHRTTWPRQEVRYWHMTAAYAISRSGCRKLLRNRLRRRRIDLTPRVRNADRGFRCVSASGKTVR